ncbi:myosin II light chain [Ophidiomyces ophidiicola]|nr:myosin II light chain [Ophidiomyces ophidiicola]
MSPSKPSGARSLPTPKSQNHHHHHHTHPNTDYIYDADPQASTNYKEAFSLFDKRGTGRVTLESLGDLLRARGGGPAPAGRQDPGEGMGGDFDFDAFQKVLNRPGGFRDPGEPEEYCRGFQVFDKDMTGFIGVGQLRYILTNLGEKMTDEEVDELLKAVDTSSGEINYTELVRTILAN